MSEADELQAPVEILCERLGLRYHHCRHAYSCSGQAGFPDLVIAGVHGVIFAELKLSSYHKRNSQQSVWFHTLEASGQNYRLWTKQDLKDGIIERELLNLR